MRSQNEKNWKRLSHVEWTQRRFALACERGVAYFGRLADTDLMEQKMIKPDKRRYLDLGINQSKLMIGVI